MDTLGQRIKKRRTELGLTQSELAKKLGYKSFTTINKIESDINDITTEKVMDFAKALNTSTSFIMGWTENINKSLKIPVLGRVAAGTPIEAIEDIIDYEEISEEMAKKGEYFALQIKGESMQPKFDNGDVVIVKKQEQVENGEIAIVLVNGNDATCKRIKKTSQGIMLIPNNTNYETMFYTNKDIKDLPIKIIGKVVELRAKF